MFFVRICEFRLNSNCNTTEHKYDFRTLKLTAKNKLLCDVHQIIFKSVFFITIVVALVITTTIIVNNDVIGNVLIQWVRKMKCSEFSRIY